MTTISTIDGGTLAVLTERHAKGESLKTLAAEVGVSWQKLWGLVKGSGTPAPKIRRALQARPGAASLPERYRPSTLEGMWGQERAVKVLAAFAAAPYPQAFLFEGATGTGKTTAALALAAALGCDVEQHEFGGVHVIASGEQTADSVREVCRLAHLTPMYGSGWKVVVVNEADRMGLPAEMVWLDRLEQISPRTVIVFTTNSLERLSQRFIDRCCRVTFEADADKLRASAEAFVAAVWQAETGHSPDTARVRSLVEQSTVGREISFRRLMQDVAMAIAEEA